MEHGGHSHGGHGGHGMSLSSNVTHEPPPPSYFYHTEHTALLYAHIILSLLAWAFALPIAVFLSIAKSRYTFPAHLVFSALNGATILFGLLYNTKTPDLYEKNVHHRLGWLFSFLAAGLSLTALVQSLAPKPKPKPRADTSFTFPATPYKPVHTYNWSRDSGVGSDEDPASPRASLPGSPGMEEEQSTLGFGRSHDIGQFQNVSFHGHNDNDDDDYQDNDENDDDHLANEDRGLLGNSGLRKVVGSYSKVVARSRAIKLLAILYETINRLILILGFVLILTGIVTYGGLFKGKFIFSGLAHFIKGGIFFWYGLLTLGRAMGSFAELGWAWNMKPTGDMVGKRAANTPSFEFFESFIIFFYGSTNVFLEHLASQDGRWTATDLEHVSIAVMFLGGGLCGMLVESKWVRGILNSTVTSTASLHGYSSHASTWQEPKSYGFSLNPMPALVIMLLGIMMSSHTQESMVSTMLHSQWGTLFVAASLARGVTYLLIYLSPPTSYLPSRPPSEVIAAFCFISGGMIFMCSNKSMVAGMENLELNAMFLFTVLMGLTAFVMAWEIAVMALKGVALQKEQRANTRSLSSASTQA